jgi:hypothetical protein
VTPEERERMNQLCQQIQIEKDPQIFHDLVQQLLDLLEQKHKRIHPEHKTKLN